MVDLVSPEDPATLTYENLVKVVSQHLNPEPSIIAERYKFRSRRQESGEDIAQFVAALKSLAKFCKFQEALDDNLRDALVAGLRNDKIKQQLLSQRVLTFQKAIGIARRMEMAEKDVAAFEATSEVHKVKAKERQAGRNWSQHKGHQKLGAETASRGKEKQERYCWNCGLKNHTKGECFFKNAVCDNCGGKGHLKYVCRNKEKVKRKDTTKEKMSYVQSVEKEGCNRVFDEDTDNNLFNIKDNTTDIKAYPIYAKVKVENALLNMEVDTGCEYSLISGKVYNRYFSHLNISKSNIKLSGYTGTPVGTAGFIMVNVQFTNNSKRLKLYVVPEGGPCLVGRNWMQNLGINVIDNEVRVNKVTENMKLEKLIEEYGDIFDNKLGLLKNFKAKLHLKAEAVPVFCKSRSLPINIKSKVEDELNRLVNENILTPVEYSQWASPIVPVLKKNGDIRICGDFKVAVNRNLNTERYHIPKVDNLLAHLGEGTHFTKIDLSQAYAQIELDSESRELVTINTHKGLFSYNRLPYGISSSPAIFQRIIDSLCYKLKGVIAFMDDILVTGATEKEHLENLKLLFNKIQESGLKINLSKCSFFQKSVSYLGYTIDAEGLHPSNDKVKALTQMKQPTNKVELQSFLGFVNFHGKFIPNVSSRANPLYKLLRKNSRWHWNKQCQKSFEWIKGEIKSAKVLMHYNQKLPLGLACDASSTGVGACIFHILENGDRRPIAFASRSLNSAEKNYSQIDKEALAIIFGVKRFNDYLFGRKFFLYSDHKPLLAIFGENKQIPQLTASRLQRWAIILASFDYELKYVKSKHNYSDALSRLSLQETPCENTDFGHILHVTETLAIDHKLLAKETQRDPMLREVFRYCVDGWPLNIPIELKPYFNRKDQLHIEHGCIIWGLRVIVPKNLQAKILEEIHSSHLGINKCKSLARSYCYWPYIDNDITNVCKNCSACSQLQCNPQKTILQPWPQTNKVWSRIHLDFLGPIYGHKYLVVIDSHSKWLEVKTMNNSNASAVINYLTYLFSIFGLPDTVVSDNGQPFSSNEFSKFLQNNGIIQLFSPPYHPASNGAAESSVKTVKRRIIKAHLEKENIGQALLHFLFSYRNVPHSTTGVSPAEIMFGRHLKSRLSLLRPSQVNINNRQTQRQIDNYKGVNRTFEIGDKVLVKDYAIPAKPTRSPGIIRQKSGNVICEVEVEQGKIVKRHSNQIRLQGSCSTSTDSCNEQQNVKNSVVTATNRDITVPISSVARGNDDVNIIPNQDNIIPNPDNIIPNQDNVIPNQDNVIANQDNVNVSPNSVVRHRYFLRNRVK
ncbi:uncharacterized protein K02A2.6-like [Zophobas morio]|uniref:uncharacterized protein K02A2.6-like n=1 Tax=Zophobas morio TaxID=2755281 RepID=UPI003082B4E8